ncbi:MAG: hypothetical protein IID08_04850 [Candidatus Hydrogenedentes bacterium]|nr:hypothetical protein [Candidatus Hydrogenedentota bacterium]
MFSLADVQDSQIERTWESASAQVATAKTLEKAAGAFIGSIYEEFEVSLALARFFLTIPFRDLPERNRIWVEILADDNGVSGDLHGETPVLSLVASRGTKTAWNDIRSSRGHVGIPLVSPVFISEMPMMAKMLQELGVVENLVGDARSPTDVEASPFSIRTFHVPDAAESVDSQGRKIIPAQDFVSENAIRTVFGLGRPYTNEVRNVAIAIFFAKEQLAHEIVRKFEPVMDGFQNETVGLVENNAFFNES